MTPGERRVRIDFNPTDQSVVRTLKQMQADFIDTVNALPDNNDPAETERLKQAATLHAEIACMLATKIVPVRK